MRLRKRRGGLPVARPQTPHVPSCRLKLGTPRVLVCVLKTHGKSREFTRRANRDHGGGRGRGRAGNGRRWWREEKSTHELTRDQTRALQGRRSPQVATVVRNKTVFHHEISVWLRQPRRIKSSYESYVIDDFDDGPGFPCDTWNRPLCRFQHICSRIPTFRAALYYGSIYNLACKTNASLIQAFQNISNMRFLLSFMY